MLAVCAGHVITAFVLVYAHTALWAWLRVKKGKIHQVQVAFAAEALVPQFPAVKANFCPAFLAFELFLLLIGPHAVALTAVDRAPP